MLLNNLDPEVAEQPEELIVYGGSGKAARSPAALRALVRSLLELGEDETLLVQSGKPVGIFRTHRDAPRVLIANSLLVPHWATWEEFRRLEALGLTMFGQMTAGSWIYIGTQGILQGTYQTFAAAGEKHYGSADLAGRTILTAGLGGMGGAQPLAATMAGAAILCVEVDPTRIERRLETRYLDEASDSLDDALARVRAAASEGRALSVGLAGERGRGRPRAGPPRRAVRPRHRPDGGPRSAERLRPGRVLGGGGRGACACPIRTRICNKPVPRSQHMCTECSSTPAQVPMSSTTATTCEGRPYRPASRTRSHTRASSRPISGRSSAAASGPSAGRRCRASRATSRPSTRCSAELFPDDPLLQRWLELAGDRVAFQGLPARICWLGYGARAKAGLAINELVRSGEVSRADRDRARPPRRGLGRLALPRDGGDAGRLRRDRRLADPERAREHGGGRDLGQRPPRRRRRDRQLDPRRHGRRRRRHRRRGRAARARAHDGSGHGRDPPCRRGLRGGARAAAEQGVALPGRDV